jgi:hypothetical protein
MSAFIACKMADKIHLLSDGAQYSKDGVLSAITSKCFPIGAHGGSHGVITGRGDARIVTSLAKAAEWNALDFDDFIDSIPGFEELLGGEPVPFELAIAGWSGERERLELYLYCGHTFYPWAGCEPFELHEVKDENILLAAPSPQDSTLMAMGWTPLPSVEAFTPERDGVAFMQAQRRTLSNDETAGHIDPGLFFIGGHVACATVTRHGVENRIVHRWPEDRIGSKIHPAPIAVGGAAPADDPGLTRQQRRALERERRKVVA